MIRVSKEGVDRFLTYEVLDQILDTLETPSREFLQMRYSLIPYDCGKIRSYREIGVIYGISHTAARKKHIEIIKKIRSILSQNNPN